MRIGEFTFQVVDEWSGGNSTVLMWYHCISLDFVELSIWQNGEKENRENLMGTKLSFLSVIHDLISHKFEGG